VDLPELSFRLRAVPAAVFVDLLRQADEPLDAKTLKQRLAASGVAKDEVDQAWRRAQPGVKRHAHVVDIGRGRYQWSATPIPVAVPVVSPAEALERLVAGRVPSGLKADLADLVRRALAERDQLEHRLRVSHQGAREARGAQERQLRIDAARAVADVAMEVEELAAAGADPEVTVERIRALAKAFDLDPIGRAGDQVAFDPRAHTPIGGYPADGSAVVVIRPGYSWRAGDQDVLVAKAQVAAGTAAR